MKKIGPRLQPQSRLPLRLQFENFVQAIWFGKQTNPLAGFLFRLIGTPVAWLTKHKASGVRSRISNAKHATPPSPPVLIIGNLIAGGTGKTPLTIAIANALSQRGRSVGLICRGDGASKPVASPVMVDQHSQPDTIGDEAILLFRLTQRPVSVCTHREQARRNLLLAHTDIDLIISDDGLQHEALSRSIELAVFDKRGAGNGHLLPVGPLREPLSHLTGMDGLIVNRGFNPEQSLTLNPAIDHANTFHSDMTVRDVVSLDHFQQAGGATSDLESGQSIEQFAASQRGKSVAALAGIGNPVSFFGLLEAAGLPFRPIPKADHGALHASELSSIPEPVIIMTAKDAVKCPPDPRAYVLRVQANPPTDLINWITEKLNGLPAA